MTVHHLAILGMSFTGSTILSYALGAMPGCSNIDEAHWLVDGTSEHCCHCGPSCEVWTAGRRDALRHSPTFYTDVRAALSADVLISADKDPQIYDRLEPATERRYIMLYRDPIAQSRSALKAAVKEGTTTELTLFLDYWVDKNIELLARVAQHGGNRILNLADFQADPIGTLQKVCRSYGLTYTRDWETYWEKPQHPIGGNFNPFTHIVDGEPDRAKIRATAATPYLPNDHKDSSRLLRFIDGHRMNLRNLSL